MTTVISIPEMAAVAFFVWGGLLSLRCLLQARGVAFPSYVPRFAVQAE